MSLLLPLSAPCIIAAASIFLLQWRMKTNARRMRRRDNALYLVFKIVERLSRNWRALNGGANLMTLVLQGCQFKDGILQREELPELAGARS